MIWIVLGILGILLAMFIIAALLFAFAEIVQNTDEEYQKSLSEMTEDEKAKHRKQADTWGYD